MKPENRPDLDSENGIDRRGVLRAAGATAFGATAFAGSASAHACCVDCVEVGKIEGAPRKDKIHEFEYDGRTVTIEVKEVTREDGEVVCASVRISGGKLCKVVVKGGPDDFTRVLTDGDCSCKWCGHTELYPCAPDHHNENRDKYEISNITFYLCLTDETSNSKTEESEDGSSKGESKGKGKRKGKDKGKGRGKKRGH